VAPSRFCRRRLHDGAPQFVSDMLQADKVGVPLWRIPRSSTMRQVARELFEFIAFPDKSLPVKRIAMPLSKSVGMSY
jgi:hypothetical protein